MHLLSSVRMGINLGLIRDDGGIGIDGHSVSLLQGLSPLRAQQTRPGLGESDYLGVLSLPVRSGKFW